MKVKYMPARDFVLSKIPNAIAERRKSDKFGSHWIIKFKDSNIYFASGKSIIEAWVQARKFIKGEGNYE